MDFKSEAKEQSRKRTIEERTEEGGNTRVGGREENIVD